MSQLLIAARIAASVLSECRDRVVRLALLDFAARLVAVLLALLLIGAALLLYLGAVL